MNWLPAIRFFMIVLLILLMPIIVIAILIGFFLSQPKKRTNDDVANFLRGASDGTLTQDDWARFIAKPIRDGRLDAIRKRAAIAGPPDADILMLRQLEKEARLTIPDG